MKLSAAKFAAPLGYKPGIQQAYESGSTEPDSRYWIQLVQAYPSIDLSYILTGKRGMDTLPGALPLVRVPVLARIPASGFVQSFDDVLIEDWVATSQVQHQGMFALRVRGDSMSPAIEEGDRVILAPDLPFVNGAIYAVVTRDGEHTLKEVRKEGESYLCIPLNRRYTPMIVHESNIIKLVRVVEINRKLEPPPPTGH